MIILEIGLEIRHRGGVVTSLCAIEDKTAVVVVASYRSVSRNPVRFKALSRAISVKRGISISVLKAFKIFIIFLVQH